MGLFILTPLFTLNISFVLYYVPCHFYSKVFFSCWVTRVLLVLLNRKIDYCLYLRNTVVSLKCQSNSIAYRLSLYYVFSIIYNNKNDGDPLDSSVCVCVDEFCFYSFYAFILLFLCNQECVFNATVRCRGKIRIGLPVL